MTLAGANWTPPGHMQVMRSEDEWSTPPPLNEETGSAFGWFDRAFSGYQNGLIFDYGDWEARDIEAMFKRGYKARQIEQALSLPIMGAEHTINPIKGDSGEAEFINEYWATDPFNGGCDTSLREIIDLNTSAFSYKRAYWELVYAEGKGDFEGKTVYDTVAWRPQTTCRLAYEPQTGKMRGFEQEAFYIGPEITKSQFPIYIPTQRAYVYLHGKRRDPLHGTSEMEIPYWCYKTTQRLLFLWFQFLEGVSLPRTIVKANDQGVASGIARQIAALKSSGVLPIAVPGDPNSVAVDVLDLSGKGADQFQAVITWLDQAAVNSVLAGFLNLTNVEKSGGSYALSNDQSDFFLQTRQADAREMEQSIRRDLFGPLIRYNFGPGARIPEFKFAPLNTEDKTLSVEMLQALMRSKDPQLIPSDFVGQLAKQVADYLGMDGDKVEQSFAQAAAKFEAIQTAAAQAEAKAAALANNPLPNSPTASSIGVPANAAPNTANAAKVAGAVMLANAAVRGAQADKAGVRMTPSQRRALQALSGKK